MATVTRLPGNTAYDRSNPRFRAEDERGYCEFSVSCFSSALSSFGGSLWPANFPDLFEHFGPDTGCITHRSGYAIRPDIALPIA